MAWNTLSPDVTLSVSANKTVIQDNTTYIKTTMNEDHFWDEGANEDGHHRFVQMPKFTTPQLAITPADPTLDTSMDGIYYCKQKSAADAPAQQDVQCFYKNQSGLVPSTSQVMQVVGARVMGSLVFTAGVITPKYYHNVTSITGTYVGTTATITVTFPELPSENYLVFNNSNVAGNFSITTRTTTSLVFSGASMSALNRFYFMIIGG